MAQLWDEDEVDTPLGDQCTECGKAIRPDQPWFATPGMAGRRSHAACSFVVLDVAFKSAGL